MAEALLKKSITDCGKLCENVQIVASAGVGALVDHPADLMAQKLMCEEGIDISTHRARQVDQTIIDNSDLILVMERQQKRFIEISYPSARGKVFLLGEQGDMDIIDPYRKSEMEYRESLELIKHGVADWLKKIKG